MTLLARKSQLKLAEQGADLLDSKREALLKEMLDMVRPLMSGHSDLEAALPIAKRSLTFAEGLDGRNYIEAAGFVSGKSPDLDVEEESFWGVKLPAISTIVDADVASETSASDLTARTVEAGRDFRKVGDALLKQLPLHAKLSSLGTEIKKTTRQVNALQQVLIPDLKDELKSISQTLEEMEREDMFRLRRIKKKREAQ